MSFNPETGLVYIPTQSNSFSYATQQDFAYTPGAWNRGIATGALDVLPRFPETDYGEGTGAAAPTVGALVAWDPIARRARWRVNLATHSNGGTLTTAGNLVFQGTAAGHLLAYRADNGMRLWDVELGPGILAPPMTYSIDGRQYLSVLVGWGGTTGLFGYNGSGEYKAPGRLWTFALGGDRDIEPVHGIDKPRLTAIEFEASDAEIARGADLYASRCAMCHGGGASSGGAIADLRYSTAATFDIFEQIVRDGAYSGLGMPRLGDVLTVRETQAIKRYLLSLRAQLIDAE
jgi:quinohemoprotein ethanol dehydrogenase